MLIKAGNAPTELLLTLAAVSVSYHRATVLDHSAQLWQEQRKVAVVAPTVLVQPRVVGVHVHQLLTDKRRRLHARNLLVFSASKVRQRTVNTPVD
jgi:hypothetical protein